MSQPVVQYTNAGLAELISAKNQGIKGAIAWVAVGDRSYQPSATQTQLYNERQRERVADWVDMGPTQLKLAAAFKGNLEYEVREIGYFLESGTLLAVYSVPNTLLTYKSASSSWVPRFTLDISPLPTSSVTVVVGTENLNIFIDEEMMMDAVAFVRSQVIQTKQAHVQMQLSERLRNLETGNV